MMPSYYDGDAARLDSFSHQKCDGLVCQVTHKSGKTSAMVKKAMMMPSLVVVVMMKRLFFAYRYKTFCINFDSLCGGKGLSRLEHPQRKNSFGHFKASPISLDVKFFYRPLVRGKAPTMRFPLISFYQQHLKKR